MCRRRKQTALPLLLLYYVPALDHCRSVHGCGQQCATYMHEIECDADTQQPDVLPDSGAASGSYKPVVHLCTKVGLLIWLLSARNGMKCLQRSIKRWNRRTARMPMCRCEHRRIEQSCSRPFLDVESMQYSTVSLFNSHALMCTCEELQSSCSWSTRPADRVHYISIA